MDDNNTWKKTTDELPEPGRWVDITDDSGVIRECRFYLCGCKREWRDVLGYNVIIKSDELWRYSDREKPDFSHIPKLPQGKTIYEDFF